MPRVALPVAEGPGLVDCRYCDPLCQSSLRVSLGTLRHERYRCFRGRLYMTVWCRCPKGAKAQRPNGEANLSIMPPSSVRSSLRDQANAHVVAWASQLLQRRRRTVAFSRLYASTQMSQRILSCLSSLTPASDGGAFGLSRPLPSSERR